MGIKRTMGPKPSNHIEYHPSVSSSDAEEDEEVVVSYEDDKEVVVASAEKEEDDEEVVASAEKEEDDEEVVASAGEDEKEREDDNQGSSNEEEPETQKTTLPRKPETAALVDQSNESRSEPNPEPPAIQPTATKPLAETEIKPPASPVKSCSAKRPLESEREAKEPKRSKKISLEEGTTTSTVVEEVKKTGDNAKKLLFQRVFSEDDEIAVLIGMLEYHEKKGADPCADMDAFHDFVKNKIQIDVTKAQLMDKIRRLRRKFKNNAGKGKKGEDRIFSKPHEQKSFDLSKQIWGSEGITVKVEPSTANVMSNGNPKGNGKASDVMKSDEKKVKLEREGEEIRADLEAKWMKLRIAEMELFLERSDLMREYAKSILEVYKAE